MLGHRPGVLRKVDDSECRCIIVKGKLYNSLILAYCVERKLIPKDGFIPRFGIISKMRKKSQDAKLILLSTGEDNP